jgi:hypothetical protein
MAAAAPLPAVDGVKSARAAAPTANATPSNPAPGLQHNGTNEKSPATTATTTPASPETTLNRQAAATPSAPPRQDPPAQPASRHVARAQFTNGIRKLEPTDHLEPVIAANKEGLKRLYFFTELRGLKGQSVTHRWVHEGKTVASVRIDVGSNRWRAYSSKFLEPDKTGQWKVLVTDDNGETLQTARFIYE